MKTLKRSECEVLPLALKGKWYRMIESGEKREEYRAFTDYWDSRIKKWVQRARHWKRNQVVAFSLGYRKPSLFFTGSLKTVPLGYKVPGGEPTREQMPIHYSNGDANHPEWGEPQHGWYFIIALGERVRLA